MRRLWTGCSGSVISQNIRMTVWIQILSRLLFLLLLLDGAAADLGTRKIPDHVPAGILAAGMLSMLTGGEPAFAERTAGFLCVSGFLLAVDLAVPGAFGGGDIKLAAAGGFYLGWRSMTAAGAAAFLSAGAAAAILLMTGKTGRKTEIAFGPFLCMGMAVCLFRGERIAAWFAGQM